MQWESTYHPSLSLIPSKPNLSHSYWTLHFDSAPRTLRSLNSIMRRDPRVIRWTILKLGDKVEDIGKEGQKMLRPGSEMYVSDVID